jgi:hypothetical protein
LSAAATGADGFGAAAVKKLQGRGHALVFIKEVLDPGLNGSLDAVGTAIAEVGVLKLGFHHGDADLGAHLVVGNDARISLGHGTL